MGQFCMEWKRGLIFVFNSAIKFSYAVFFCIQFYYRWVAISIISVVTSANKNNFSAA